jgi:prolipoprotein diacylglyceryl transferase
MHAASLPAFSLHWFSLFLALGLLTGYLVTRWIFSREAKSLSLVESLFLYVFIGTLLGARLGHCLFYEPSVYLHTPLRILQIWEGGLAGHGALLGAIVALIIHTWRHPELSFFWLTDRLGIAAVLCGACVSIGNFFNSECYGKPTQLAWAVIFKSVDLIPRHPAQIYEAIGYLLIAGLLAMVYLGKSSRLREGQLFGLALLLVFGFRFGVEFFKENQAAFETGIFMNVEQLLSLPLIQLGAFFLTAGHFRLPILHRGLSRTAWLDAACATMGLGMPTTDNYGSNSVQRQLAHDREVSAWQRPKRPLRRLKKSMRP